MHVVLLHATVVKASLPSYSQPFSSISIQPILDLEMSSFSSKAQLKIHVTVLL